MKGEPMKKFKAKIEVEFDFWVLDSPHQDRDADFVVERAVNRMNAWGKVRGYTKELEETKAEDLSTV